MKKRLLLGLLAAPLILASCGGTEPAESKEGADIETSQSTPEAVNSQGEAPGESTPEANTSTAPELTRAEKVAALFARMATGASSTFVDPTTRSLEYYGDSIGFMNIYTEAYLKANTSAYNGGLAVIKNYGIFSFSYDTDTETVDGAQIYSPNTALTIGDLTYTTKDLGLAATNATFTEGARTHTFTTNDETFCSVLAAIDGYGSVMDQYPTKKVTFNISDDGEKINNLTLSMTGATDKTTYKDISESGLSIERVGTTIDLDIEVFAKNTVPTASTAWGTQLTSIFTQYIHSSFSLPFPSFATYAAVSTFDQSPVDSSAYEFYFYDLKCGDKTANYAAQLTAAGFSLAAGTTGTYEKTLEAATANSDEVRQVVTVAFQDTTGTEYATIYPYGFFAIESYTREVETLTPTATVISALGAVMSVVNTTESMFPNFSFGNTTGIVYKDLTADAQAYYGDTYDQVFYGSLKIYYATLAEAQAAVASIISYLTKLGYTESYYASYYGYDIYYEKELGSAYSSQLSATCEYYSEVMGYIAYDDDDNYLGYIVLAFDYYGAESSGYDYDYDI